MAHSFVLRTRGFASQEGPGPRPQGGCPHEGAGTTLGRRRGLAAFRGPVSANARHVVSTGMRACMVWCNYLHHPRRDLSTVNRFPVTSDTPSGTSKRASSRTPIGRPQGSPGRRSCSRAPIPPCSPTRCSHAIGTALTHACERDYQIGKTTGRDIPDETNGTCSENWLSKIVMKSQSTGESTNLAGICWTGRQRGI